MKVVVTGSNGFIGSHLTETLEKIGFQVIGVIKKGDFPCLSFDSFIDDGFLNSDIDVVVHLAGAAHKVFSDIDAEELNFNLTKKVFDKALELNVRRFIYISTCNIYCEQSNLINLNTCFSERLVNTSATKLLAEKYITSIRAESSIETTIIRSPLVYGEGVKANFASLMSLVSKGLPLPFRSMKNNKRSLVSVYNLVDLIKVCIEHPKAANKIFLASDDCDLSTAEMVALMAKVQGKRNMSLPVPVWCFKLLGKVLNKSDVIDRLTGSLQLDISHTKNTLDWKPPYSVEHGFKLAVKMDEKND